MARFWSSVVVIFNEKLKVYLNMHGNNNDFLVLKFLLEIPITKRKSAGSLS